MNLSKQCYKYHLSSILADYARQTQKHFLSFSNVYHNAFLDTPHITAPCQAIKLATEKPVTETEVARKDWILYQLIKKWF